MLKVKRPDSAILIAGICLLYPQIASSEIFKSSDFLTWKRDSQDFYIEASVGMASLIADQRDKAKARCIDNWYYADEGAANSFVLSLMRENPTYHPRGIILGVIQKKCGNI